MVLTGPIAIAAIAVAAVVVVGLVLVAFRGRIFRGRRTGGPGRSVLAGRSRIEVLETTVIDEERKLVLVRCDKIEHLIMVGGPADLVVENDVKKVRPAAPGKTPSPLALPSVQPANPLRVPPTTGASIEAEIAAIVPKSSEAPRISARPKSEPRPSVPAPHPVAPPTRPAARGGEASVSAASARGGETPRIAAQRPSASETGRREVAAQRRTSPPASPQAARPSAAQRSQASASADRHARPARGDNRGTSQPVGMPAAQTPWPEPDSIESEIVAALSLEPHAHGNETRPAEREPASAKSIVDSSATLGDLADRLEEALAREMQSVADGGPAEVAAEDFAFGNDAPEKAAEPERPKQPAARDRQEPRERQEKRSEPARQAANPEPRRDAPPAQERREEAPVISLNARRREAADPLEDEMARLLGELTGDTKGR